MKVVSDKIIARRMHVEDLKRESGIIIPISEKSNQYEAQVLAVGPGTDLEQMVAKVGDIIVCPKNAGVQILYEGEEVISMRQSSIYYIK